MNLWMRLPNHPNIVPFDRVVIDELEGRVFGFTTEYVPGENLEINKARVFKLKYLQQLIQVVDDLNFRYGIAHQDIAPRNLLIDPSTDCVKLFDFNFSSRIKWPAPDEGECYNEERNDIKGVVFTMYEIITQDESPRDHLHEPQSLDEIEKMDWQKHPEVNLDHPVAAYRLVLQEWQQRRAADPNDIHIGNAPEAINWPPRPEPPPRARPGLDINMRPITVTSNDLFERRQSILERGGKVLNWERPPQKVLDEGIRVLSNGEVITCEKL